MHGWAADRTERAEDAAIPGLWPKERVATSALVEVEASVGRHGFERRESALRAGQDGFEDRRRVHRWAPDAGAQGAATASVAPPFRLPFSALLGRVIAYL